MTDSRTATVSVGGRLHFGFGNLSLAHERLYGGVGVGIDRPRVVVSAEPAQGLQVIGDDAGYARRAIGVLDVEGARVRVRERLPEHVGLGSGTRLALAVSTAIAHAHGLDADPRSLAPELGRGGRSGVGVATFEDGGFVVDGGHPTTRFTADAPAIGDWSVPPVVARHTLPRDWRAVVVVPDAAQGRHGDDEDATIRTVVEEADPAIADEIAGLLHRRLLPAVATGDLESFGSAVAEVGRLNGAWYADEQGGVYRPPIGRIVDDLSADPAVAGVGQSSWGPAVYALTDADRLEDARLAARETLDDVDLDGEVITTTFAADGARVEVTEDAATAVTDDPEVPEH